VRARFAGGTHEYYTEYIDTLIRLNRPGAALAVLERSRARALLMMLAERDLVFDRDLPPELVKARQEVNFEYDRVQQTLGQLDPGTKKDEIARLEVRLRDLGEARARVADRIRDTSPRLAALTYPRPLDQQGVQQALDPGTVLLSYSVGKERSLLFAIEHRRTGSPATRIAVHEIPFGEQQLTEQVRAFRSLIERHSDAAHLPVVDHARRLYDTLIAPAQQALASADHVLISPDGPLHNLPFAALARVRPRASRQARAPHQFLIEWKPIHTVVSATVYAELKKARSPASPAATLVAFGDPRYPRQSDTPDAGVNPQLRGILRRGYSFEPLPATRLEVQAIEARFGADATTYLGEQATEERAKSIRSARYLHFATHGLLDARMPLNSALVLTIPSGMSPGTENGFLQAWEIFESMRLDADLVTLSACETALGTQLSGEGLIGLTRAFHYAGARSVLASLWSVADESTARLMAGLYQHLHKGVAKDEALRRAQLKVMDTPKTSAPFHWAAFTLSGDWR